MQEIYLQAWLIYEEMANLIRDAWYRGGIDEDQALQAWCMLVNPD